MISLRSILVFITVLVAVSAGTTPEGVAFLTKKAAEEGYVESRFDLAEWSRRGDEGESSPIEFSSRWGY